MNKLYLSSLIALTTLTAFFSSCSYNPGSSTPPDTTHNSKLTFKKDYHAKYDLFVVDTGKNGNNVDIILNDSRIQLQDIVMDTGLHYQGKYPVVKINSFQGNTGVATDSQYFYQDPNGDLYRYNFGFSILNQYTFLTQAIGHPVDVGWVLAAKLASASGTTWMTAKIDTEHIQSPQIDVYIVSQATMKNDTTIIVGTESIKARHVQHHVTASTPASLPENGEVIIDSYMSENLSNILIDFFRHSTLQGSLANSKTQGKLKIMTSHD